MILCSVLSVYNVAQTSNTYDTIHGERETDIKLTYVG